MWLWLMNAITLRSRLVVVAKLQGAVGMALLDQLALALGERAGEQDCDERSAGVLVQQLDRRGRDHR
jgi:hypothetical protein